MKLTFSRGENIILENNIARVPRSPYKIKLPKIDSELAYLTGYHLGDGYLEDYEDNYNKNRKPNYEITYADKYKEQIDIINSIFRNKFNINLIIYTHKNQQKWVGKIHSKVLVSFFNTVLNIPKGKRTKLEIPGWIFENKEFLRNFIAGFFDAEGCISLGKDKKFKLGMVNKDRQFLEELRDLIKQNFNVNFPSPYKKFNQDCWEMRTGSKINIKNFIKEINIRHPDKLIKSKSF